MNSGHQRESAAPILETARLTLRGHRVNDFPEALAMWSDPVVTRFIGGKPSTEQQTWSRLLNYAGHWALMGFGYWAIEEKASRRFIGEMGFADFKREIAPPMRNVPELGFAIASPFHGRGFAMEALKAVVAWGDAHLGARTVAVVSAENEASRHIVERLGYTL
ncbi:MAG: GNAT family N-acetyltransferase, partial [Candidatus Eremiobacteraeota bacterium]|nr:GNAT family N-acetyltransferase [Candidatus Eremiobacteraeota bacterium]